MTLRMEGVRGGGFAPNEKKWICTRCGAQVYFKPWEPLTADEAALKMVIERLHRAPCVEPATLTPPSPAGSLLVS